MKTTMHKLVRDDSQNTTVLFSEQTDGQIKVYTFGTYTDYTTTFFMSKDEARQCWKDLVAKGFKRGRSERVWRDETTGEWRSEAA